jgi:hypothetical protein
MNRFADHSKVAKIRDSTQRPPDVGDPPSEGGERREPDQQLNLRRSEGNSGS